MPQRIKHREPIFLREVQGKKQKVWPKRPGEHQRRLAIRRPRHPETSAIKLGLQNFSNSGVVLDDENQVRSAGDRQCCEPS
jgi:hypothetical protein